jgi:hypothetical protein
VPRHSSRAGRRAGRIFLGLAALTAMLVLVVAVPLVLLIAWRILGPPVPSLHELTSPDDGTLFVRVLCLIGWAGWATFTWSVLAELLAQWRGWRLPAFGWQRRTAAGLVTAITMMLSSPAVAAATATPVRAAPVIVAAPPHTTLGSSAAPGTAALGPAPAAATGYIEHRLQPGEQMPALAERYLGDKYQWQVIAAATYGIPQPVGQVLRPGDSRMYPGQIARIPMAAARTHLATAAGHMTTDDPAVTATVYRASHGDWVWYIADRFLGDPERYTDIAALNPQLVHKYGGRFPDHVEPGDELHLPADVHDRGPRPHATGTVLAPAPAASTNPGGADLPPGGNGPAGTQPGATATPTIPASPSASPSASATPNASPSTAPASPSPAATTAHPAGSGPAPSAANGHQSAEDGSMLDTALLIGVPLVGAGLLATLLLTTLRRRRHRQEQHRPVGHRLPAPDSPKVETQMRVVAEPIAVDRLDHALRVLAAGLGERPAEQMPDIVGAWLTGETLNLLLTGPCPNPPAPWAGNQLIWTLPADVPLLEVGGQLAPLPTLVAVGSQPGTHLLLDLERLGLLTITGDPGRAADLLRYLAAELSLNAWSDHVEVTIAGFDATETSELLALGADRIDAAPNVATAIDRIRRRAGQVVQSLDHLDAVDPLNGRIKDIAADAWMPHVLLVNEPGPQEITALETLDSDLAATGRCAVAIAVTNGDPVGRWPVAIDADGMLNVGFLGMSAHDATAAARLPRAELTNLADLLSTARRGTPTTTRSGQPDHDTEADWPTVPPAPETEPWAQGTDAAGALLAEQPDQPRDRTDSMDQEDAADDEHDPTDDEAPEPADEAALPSAAPPTEHHQPRATQPQPPASPHGSVADDEVPSQPASTTGPDEAASVPPVVALVGRQPARKRASAPVRGRRHNDPTLDTDLRAWTEAEPTRPRIAILGPVTVEAPGPLPDERVRFYAEIITYLATRGQRGATTDQFDDAIWPDQTVKANTRRVAVARARRWLGEAPDGQPWLPDATADRRYRLRDGYLLDWHLFRRCRSRGEARGPAGASDLREALNLVRGAPLASADVAYSAVARNPYVWLPTSDIQPHHLAAAVVDTAHRLIELCLDGGDIAGARWAVDQAWLADPGRASDIAWRDLLRVAAAEGNTAELDQLLGELMNARDAEVPEDLDAETYRLLCDLMSERVRAGVR